MGFQTNLLLPRVLGGETGKPSVRTWTREKMPSEHEGELINEGEWMDVGGEIRRSLGAVKTLITSLAHLSLPSQTHLHLHGERGSSPVCRCGTVAGEKSCTPDRDSISDSIIN